MWLCSSSTSIIKDRDLSAHLNILTIRQINPFGVHPAAGLPPGPRSLAPDSLVSIYGQNLTCGKAVPTVTDPKVTYDKDAPTRSASYPWPVQLEGTVVTLSNIGDDWTTTAFVTTLPCPVSYVSPTQINAKLPADLLPRIYYLWVATLPHDSVSGAQKRAEDNVPILIEPIAPALFTLEGNTAAALHANYQAVSAAYPAAAGESISLYATGLGAVTLHNGLKTADATPQIFIDRLPAKVTFAGRAPGYEGLDQINVEVPAGVHRGGSVVVELTMSAPECPTGPRGACRTITRWSNNVLFPIH
jgi:uncharacterized protein (TIGR03437 family)